MAGVGIAIRQRRTAAWTAIVLATGIVLVAVYMAGCEQSRTAAAAETLAVETENRAFCGDLGFRSGSELFTRCMSGLADIRQRERERIEDQTASLL